MSTNTSLFDVTAPNWNDIPQADVTGTASVQGDGSVSLPTSQGDLHIAFHAFGVRLRIGKQGQADYGLLVSTPDIIPADIVQSEQHTTLIAGDSKLVITHSPFTFELTQDNKTIQKTATDGHFVRRYRLPPLAKVDKGWLLSLELDTDEAVYGLGEKWGGLNKRGQLVRSYNHDALGVNAEISYKNTPFCWSPSGWGVFVHTPAPVTHAVGYATWSQRAYGVLVEDECLDMFLMHGEDGNAIINTYTDLTGKAPTPPVWSLGVILSKAYYKDVPELLATCLLYTSPSPRDRG